MSHEARRVFRKRLYEPVNSPALALVVFVLVNASRRRPLARGRRRARRDSVDRHSRAETRAGGQSRDSLRIAPRYYVDTVDRDAIVPSVSVYWLVRRVTFTMNDAKLRVVSVSKRRRFTEAGSPPRRN